MSLLNEASFLVTPNSYKEDKLYAAIPTNGNGDMTVTRTGTATRVNKAGLVELVPYNLLTRSEEFDNASWAKGSPVSVTANTTIAPDGTLTADTLIGASSIDWGLSVLKRQPPTLSSSTTYTLSLYVKSLGSTTFQTSIRNNDVGGQVTVSHSINSDTWTRVEQIYTTTPTQTLVGIVFGGTDGDVAIWGAQLVKGSSALTYQKTVDRLDIPRIDYTGGGCPSILLEPLRTNLLRYSEQFDNDIFTKNFTEVSANTTTAPDGSLTADTLSGDETSNIHFLAQTASATSGVAYTQSVFAKKGTNNFLQIIGTTTGSQYDAYSWANFDLENGILGEKGDSATATITNFGNGWYRCTMTATATATASGNGFLLCLITSATSGRAETNSLTTSVYIWGAQVEAGAYPTSYIPTNALTGTRIADVINRNDIHTNNLITEAGGTWFVDLINNVVMPRDTSNLGLFIADSSDGITGNVISLRNNSGLSPKRLTINKRIAGSQTQIYVTTTDHVKVAIKWNGATADVFVNGTHVVSTTSFTSTNMEFFSGTGADVSKYIKQMALFPTPLHEDECKALTTL